MLKRTTESGSTGKALVAPEKNPASATPPNLGTVIAELRKTRGFSLDRLAKLSGVSKSMLSKIERNQANPTLGTVWRLASTFQLSIEQIVHGGSVEQPLQHRLAHEVPVIKSADNGCTIRILSPVDFAGTLEWYDITANPHSALESRPHNAGAVEHAFVIEGAFVIESGGRAIDVQTNETCNYPADVPHALRNPYDKPARALVLVTYT